ncbi:MAG: ATP-binding protein [Tahibacter sp.]
MNAQNSVVSEPVSALAALVHPVEPLTPNCTVQQAGERFLETRSAALLSLPIVEQGRVIGSISRHELMLRVYMQAFGRELHARRPITSLMNTNPLLIDAAMSIEAAGQSIGERIRRPVTEDFIVVDTQHRYVGVGIVLDVLRALENQLGDSSRHLDAAYQRLKASQNQLIQSEKLATLGQLVAGLAHEINTPLGYVQNNVEMTRDLLPAIAELLRAQAQVHDAAESGDDAGLAAGIDRLETARAACDAETVRDLVALLDDTLHGVHQIADLVGSLKDFSRVDQARSDAVDLHGLIEGALRIGAHLLKKRSVAIHRHYGTLPTLRCAPAQINQVLLNLIGNAVQAIEHDEGKIVIRTQALGGYAMVAIEDNGRGIAADILPRIFEPFFTTKPVGQGTGLGLSICQQIVQSHGGRIGATSRPGRGTRFIVALPVAGESSGGRT